MAMLTQPDLPVVPPSYGVALSCCSSRHMFAAGKDGPHWHCTADTWDPYHSLVGRSLLQMFRTRLLVNLLHMQFPSDVLPSLA